MRVEDDHLLVASHPTSSGSMSSSSETLNATEPRRLSGLVAGDTRATARPRFVTTISSPVAATSSSIARHSALNLLADTTRLHITMVTPGFRSCTALAVTRYPAARLGLADADSGRPGAVAGHRPAHDLQVQ